MVRMGKVYGNMMVDLMATNSKLRERSKRTIMMVTGVEYDEAVTTLEAAAGSVKVALVMIRARVSAEEARRRLEAAGGFVRQALGEE